MNVSEPSVPNAFSVLFGNENIKKHIVSQLRNGTFPHAYILEGGEGSGKHTLARLIACALACRANDADKPCMHCEACRKICENICPDVTVTGLSGDKKTIGVDAIRAIRESAYIAPSELDCHIYLLEDAQALTVQAQNALLKILEEPPSGVYFLLLCSNSSAMIPTVRSRAPSLKMQYFSEDMLSQYLDRNSKKAAALHRSDSVAYASLLRASDGRIGQALRLLQMSRSDKAGQLHNAVADFVTPLSRSDRAAYLLSAASIPSKREEAEAFCVQLQQALRDLAAVKRTRHAACMFYLSRAEAEDTAASFPLSALLGMLQTTQRYYEDLFTNVNVQTACMALAQELWNHK